MHEYVGFAKEYIELDVFLLGGGGGKHETWPAYSICYSYGVYARGVGPDNSLCMMQG